MYGLKMYNMQYSFIMRVCNSALCRIACILLNSVCILYITTIRGAIRTLLRGGLKMENFVTSF